MNSLRVKTIRITLGCRSESSGHGLDHTPAWAYTIGQCPLLVPRQQASLLYIPTVSAATFIEGYKFPGWNVGWTRRLYGNNLAFEIEENKESSSMQDNFTLPREHEPADFRSTKNNRNNCRQMYAQLSVANASLSVPSSPLTHEHS